MLSSLIEYDAALVMVVCDPCHLSFVICCVMDMIPIISLSRLVGTDTS